MKYLLRLFAFIYATEKLHFTTLWLLSKKLNIGLNIVIKNRKDSLEGSLDRVLLAAELEFPKILAPRLPQHTSNVNIECVGKSEWSKQRYSLYVTSFLEH